MNPRFKLFLLQHLDIDNINFSDTSILNEISNDQVAQQIVNFYIVAIKNLRINQKYKSILTNYMEWFKSLIKQYKSDAIDKFPNRIFPFISYYTEHLNSYAYFDVDFCTSILQNTKVYTFRDINPNNIFYSSRPTSNPRPVDWNNPIILVQTIEYPEFKVIDGNHRYQNAIQQNHHLPIQILPYDAITPDCFINTFNYLLFIIKNEFNRIYSLCAYSYDINIINSQIDDYKNHVLKLLETQ